MYRVDGCTTRHNVSSRQLHRRQKLNAAARYERTKQRSAGLPYPSGPLRRQPSQYAPRTEQRCDRQPNLCGEAFEGSMRGMLGREIGAYALPPLFDG